tara:strand:- start:5537 stop:6373 length:837 start_codon:yes stop_codon:yes gene_type:complete
MKNILLPTDFSANSWNALEYAVQFFKNENCIFYILHIGDLKDSDIHSNSFAFTAEPPLITIKKKIKSFSTRVEQLLDNEKHHLIILYEYGNFIDIIRKTVYDKKIALIVMGTKGISGIKTAVVGSNTGNVITQVICNVLIIPENAPLTKPKKIAFATDYNIFYTHPILNTFSEQLRISQANFNVLNVSQSNGVLTSAQEKNKEYLQDYLEEIFPYTPIFQSVSNKNIKEAILNFVGDNQIDMLTMVAKNLNFFQQLLFDTTIEKLSFYTTIPLFVIHE